MAAAEPTTTYEERLTVPVGGWVVAYGLLLVLVVALDAALGPRASLPTLLAGWLAVAVALTRAAGTVSVHASAHPSADMSAQESADEVTGGPDAPGATLRAGRAILPLTVAGAVQALDAEAARSLRGRDADPRAYLYLRGWVAEAVRVEVTDPTDPAPYWYVSTRRPAELAAAIEAAREA